MIAHGNLAIDRRQDLAPRVGFGDANVGVQSNLAHRRDRLGTTGDGHDVRKRVEEPLPIDVLGDDLHQVAEADAREEQHHVDLAGDQLMSEIDRFARIVDLHLAKGRGDKRLAAVAFDQPGELLGASAFESPDRGSLKRAGAALFVTHVALYLCVPDHFKPDSVYRNPVYRTLGNGRGG